MAVSKFELTVNLLGDETKNILADGKYVLKAGLPHALGLGFHKLHGDFVKGSLPVARDSPTPLKLQFDAFPAGHVIACRTTLNGVPDPNSFKPINPGDCYTVTKTEMGIKVDVIPPGPDTEWIDAGLSEFGINNDVLIYPVLYTRSLDKNGDLEEIGLASTSNFPTLGPFVPGTGLITLPKAANSFVTWFEFVKQLPLADGQTIDLKDMTTEFLVSSWRMAGDRFVAEVNYDYETVKTEAFTSVIRRAEGKSDGPVPQPEKPPVPQPENPPVPQPEDPNPVPQPEDPPVLQPAAPPVPQPDGSVAQLGDLIPVPQPPADSSVTRPDGPITQPDGSITQPDGSITQPDGSITQPEESEVLNEHPDELRKQIAHLQKKLEQKPDQNGV